MKKYKIGVVTFFDAFNYGAIFQTYALQVFLNTNGISSCIVDYDWQPKEKIASLKGLIYWLIHKRAINKKKNSLKQFLSVCNYSKKYNSINIKEAQEECDRFIVGSDQVWNSQWNYNCNVFYLTFTDKRFSYAASFGSVNSIASYRHKLIKDDLSAFNSISVREKSAQKYLKTLDIDSATNIDPVFLLTKDEWSKKSLASKRKNYLLIYSLENNDEMISFAKNKAKEKGLEPLIFSDTKKKKINGIKTIRYASPEEFITLFKNADEIVSNSFHGIAFSIVFNKHFYAFLQKRKNAPNDRLLDLLDDCGLSSRIVDKDFNDSTCDFKVANDFICNERKRSFAYLSAIANGLFDDKRVSTTNYFKTQYFYAKGLTENAYKKSRSGGIAYLIGKHYLDNSNIVYGAILKDNFDVDICRVIDLDSLEKTRNSKYVASNIKKTFIECETDLKNGKKVVYSALPCQISGLLNYLKSKNTDKSNLLTIDIVCHGTPKELYFKKYIEYLNNKYNCRVDSFNFRDKKYGWDTHYESFCVNGKSMKSSKYTRFFYSNYGLKEACFSCPFSNFNRLSDLTLCDAWGYIKDFDRYDGANIVIVNSEKGLKALEAIKQYLTIEQIDRLNFIQPNLMGPSPKPRNFDRISSSLNDKDFDYIYKTTTGDIVKNEKANKRKALIIKALKVLHLR